MSFGSPTPVEVAVLGTNLPDNYAYAQKIQARMAKLDYLRDLQFAQEMNYPTLDIDIDRERAGQFGLTMGDVVRSVTPAPRPRASPLPITGEIRFPGTPSRSRCNCRRTACRVSTRWAACR